MKQKTAIEWLLEMLLKPLSEWPDDINKQALAIEKEQILDAYRHGRTDEQSGIEKWHDRTALKYFNDTYHSVDANEMIDHIGDGNEMVNQVPDAGKMVEDDVEKLAEKYPYGGREGSKRLAFIDGYNKAKKTLYTEEDMWHIFAKGMGAENLQQKGVKNATQVFDTFMKSLKQPNTETL